MKIKQSIEKSQEKEKEKTKVYDLLYSYLMSGIKDYQVDSKYFKLLLKKYNEERIENEHN